MEIVTLIILLGIATLVLAIFGIIAYAIFLIAKAIIRTIASGRGFIAFLLIFTPISPIGGIWFVMQVIRNLR